MKSVCKYCDGKQLVRWGGRRRFCEPCNKSFRVPKAGRKRSKKTGMYILDRSTFRRIGTKSHRLHTTVMRGLHKELILVSAPGEHLKKI